MAYLSLLPLTLHENNDQPNRKAFFLSFFSFLFNIELVDLLRIVLYLSVHSTQDLPSPPLPDPPSKSPPLPDPVSADPPLSGPMSTGPVSAGPAPADPVSAGSVSGDDEDDDNEDDEDDDDDGDGDNGGFIPLGDKAPEASKVSNADW